MTVLKKLWNLLRRRKEVDDIDSEYEDQWTDVEADADTLRSAGWGTDEDYGG
tara:strand:+ start:2431 stop:2586 length:156 start_codon:yes stop_codon:yes gene_type:complete